MFAFRAAVCSFALLLLAAAPALAQGTYTQIDFPGAIYTQVNGIDSAGDIVGGYQDSSSNDHGFLLSGGVFTTIDDPDVPGAFAYAINDVGQIVGSNGGWSFLYDLATQTFTTIDVPNDNGSTIAYGINNTGMIVGYFEDEVGNGVKQVAFEYRNGLYKLVERQGASATFFGGVNNLNQITALNLIGLNGYNFLYVNGQFQPIRLAAKFAGVIGINDGGAVVGSYRPSKDTSIYFQGFLYQNGVFQEIAFPGSISGLAFGINNSGVISGQFVDSAENSHGYIMKPDAPAEKK